MSTLKVRNNTLEIRTLSRLIYQRIAQYPYYVLVDGLIPIKEKDKIIKLVNSIQRESDGDGSDICFTEIYINSQVEKRTDGTQQSRTSLGLPLHTDSSFNLIPHELVVFNCVEDDWNGGDTTILPIDDLVEELSNKQLNLLKEPVYPFWGVHDYPIVQDRNGGFWIRYYTAQIQYAVLKGSLAISVKHQNVLKELDSTLERLSTARTFHLTPGQILFINNHKALHGRTGLSTETNRLLHRVRARVSHLR